MSETQSDQAQDKTQQDETQQDEAQQDEAQQQSSADQSEQGQDSERGSGLENYGPDGEDDGQQYVDRSVIDFDPADGLLSGTAVDGTSDIPGPHAEGEDSTDDADNDSADDSTDDTNEQRGEEKAEQNG